MTILVGSRWAKVSPSNRSVEHNPVDELFSKIPKMNKGPLASSTLAYFSSSKNETLEKHAT